MKELALKVFIGTVLGALAAVLLSACAVYGFLWYASFDGELDNDNNAPIYVAKDEEAYGILQRLPLGDPEQLDLAVNRTGRRILPVGSGTRVRIKNELYFYGTRFYSGLLLSSRQEGQLSRVFRIQILGGSVQGLMVLVPAERFHNHW